MPRDIQMVSRVIPVDPFDLVIFGGTGDLARRKILPGLYRRFTAGPDAARARMIGAARAEMTWRLPRTRSARRSPSSCPNGTARRGGHRRFLDRLDYVRIDATGTDGWADLARPSCDRDVVRAFYFSVAPALFGDLAERLHEHGIAGPKCRIVVEKPFGRDLASARALNATLAEHFDEGADLPDRPLPGQGDRPEPDGGALCQHPVRAAVERAIRRPRPDHRGRDVGVGGRGSYYDKSGAMRDMVQNHMMQLLCLIAMEPPYHFDPDAVRDEKLKVIRALKPVPPGDIVRGQYGRATARAGYRQDAENPASRPKATSR
jgi:glucose-6-phosphate 1-dehydrogenase